MILDPCGMRIEGLMDRLFLEAGRWSIEFAADDIEDNTGTVRIGTRDMVINTLSDMSLKSGVFEYFTVERGGVVAQIQ